MAQMFEMRNRAAEFLILQNEGKEDGVQVVWRNESARCAQKAMMLLFDAGVLSISKYICG